MTDLNTVTKKDKIIVYILMSCLVTTWGFDYVVAKHALELLQPLTLLSLKYAIGLIPIFIIKMKKKYTSLVSKNGCAIASNSTHQNSSTSSPTT